MKNKEKYFVDLDDSPWSNGLVIYKRYCFGLFSIKQHQYRDVNEDKLEEICKKLNEDE